MPFYPQDHILSRGDVMKVLIMHDSKYGCGQEIAGSIDKGLRKEGHTSDVVRAVDLKGSGPEGYDAFVLGSPTHIGGPTFKVGKGIKLLGKVCGGKPYTTFTTYLDKGQGTLEKMERSAKKAGLSKIMDGRPFKVEGMKGPLEKGCTTEAEAFGREIGKALNKRV